MKRYILDADTILAFLEDRSGAEMVEDLLNKASSSQQVLQMSTVSWGEIYEAVWRAKGEAVARKRMDELGKLPIEMVNADALIANLAAELSARHKLPYISCFAAATAKQLKGVLVTADPSGRVAASDLKILCIVASAKA